MSNFVIPFNQGYVSARDKSELQRGEMQECVGAYYKPGDTSRLWKVGGRTEFDDTSSAAEVFGLALCQFDSGGTDTLIAATGAALYGATPGASGTFSAISGATSLDASADTLSVAHYSDRWYICDGYVANQVLESTGTARLMGMQEPVAAPTCATGTTSSTVIKPTGSSGDFTSEGSAYDADTTLDTYAYAARSTVGSNTETYTFGTADTGTGRSLRIYWALAAALVDDEGGAASSGGTGGTDSGVGGTTDAGFNVTVKFEKTDDDTAGTPTYTTIFEKTYTAAVSKNWLSVNLTDTTVNVTNVAVRVTFTYNSGTKQSALRVYDIRVQIGSATTAFSTTTGLYYRVTEYSQTYGLESAPSARSALVTMSSKTMVTVTLPSTEVNSITTHYRIYRTNDGGSDPSSLTLMATVPSSDTTWIDDFSVYDKDTLSSISIPLIQVTASSGSALYFARDTAPPTFKHMNSYKGSLVGISRTQTRTLAYSEPNYPESFPEINVVTSFPLPENDQLVATVTVGDTLLIACQGAMLAMNDLPRVVNGIFNASEVTPLRGQPGCVGVKAITTFSVAGEARAAWVSPYGVHVTNGSMSQRISDDIDWYTDITTANLSKAVLHWDAKDLRLVLAVDTDGDAANDMLFYFHMDPTHQKPNGLPKVTRNYGAVSCFASGQVSGVYRLYSGHVSDGSVYVEGSGTTDASQAYSSTTVPLVVTPGRIYGPDGRWLEVVQGNLRHTDGGTNETISITWNVYGDFDDTSETCTETVDLDGYGGDPFWVGIMGEAHELTLSHAGAASFGLIDIQVEARAKGRAGTII